MPAKLSPEEKQRRRNVRAKAWRLANKTRERESNLRWRQRHPERLKEMKAAYRRTSAGKARDLWHSAQRRAKKRGEPFLLSLQRVVGGVVHGYCEATGLPFIMEPGNGRSPFTPSIDRIDSTKGYTDYNVRIVVWAFNMACAEWGEEVLWKVVAARWPERIKEKPCRRTTSSTKSPEESSKIPATSSPSEKTPLSIES